MQLKSKIENNYLIETLQYSPFDESQICVGSSSLCGEVWDGELFIVENGNRMSSCKTDSGIGQIHYAGTKEKPIIVAATDECNLLLFSAKISTKANLYQLSSLSGHDDFISSVDVILDTQTAITGSWDRTYSLYFF